MYDMMEMFIALIAIARPDLDDRNTRMTAIFLCGQPLILRISHASVCRTLGTDTLGIETQAMLIAGLRAITLCVLSEQPE
jgi:hypothetical protein